MTCILDMKMNLQKINLIDHNMILVVKFNKLHNLNQIIILSLININKYKENLIIIQINNCINHHKNQGTNNLFYKDNHFYQILKALTEFHKIKIIVVRLNQIYFLIKVIISNFSKLKKIFLNKFKIKIN